MFDLNTAAEKMVCAGKKALQIVASAKDASGYLSNISIDEFSGTNKKAEYLCTCFDAGQVMKAPLIEFKDVIKRFGDKTVLDGINLKIYEDQITTIIGKSGTGKSVLLKHIIGLLKPDEGTILFRGKPANAMKKREEQEYRSRLVYLFQSNALFDSMTVFDNVAFPLRQTTNLNRAEIEKRVLRKIEDMELSEAIHRFPAELSVGMQKRVAVETRECP